MPAAPGMDDETAPFMTEVARACAADPRLSTLGGGILAAVALGIAHDSRAFARMFGIEHALVLRDVNRLVELDRLTVTHRDERTQRCRYAALPAGNQKRAFPPPNTERPGATLDQTSS